MWTDQLDQAAELEERERVAMIKKRKPEETRTGHCKFCEEPIEKGHLFCGLECRGEWERLQALLAIQGKRR